MLKKLSIILIVFTVVFNVVLEKAYASDWPSDDFDLNLNRAVVDTTVNDKIESSYFDSDNYVTKFVSGDGMVFYTAGAANSYIVYAYNISNRSLVWSK